MMKRKQFDAVAMMRSARDEIETKTEGMTLEEELHWLASQVIDDPYLQRLQKLAAQRADAVDRPVAER